MYPWFMTIKHKATQRNLARSPPNQARWTCSYMHETRITEHHHILYFISKWQWTVCRFIPLTPILGVLLKHRLFCFELTKDGPVPATPSLRKWLEDFSWWHRRNMAKPTLCFTEEAWNGNSPKHEFGYYCFFIVLHFLHFLQRLWTQPCDSWTPSMWILGSSAQLGKPS